MRLALLLVAALLPLPAAAQVRPMPGNGDPRVQSVDYSAEQVVQLRGAPGYQLTVELGGDEHIENVAVGDSGAWQVTASKSGDRLFIKPIQAGVATNMTVITDVRTYAFDLQPLFGPQPDMAYTVRFRYPAPPPAPGAQPAGGANATTTAIPAGSRGRYKVSGARAIRPAGIDDDGARTYIEWPADKPLPAVYSIDDAGREALVNGNMRDGIYVIDSVMARLVFRLDKQVARATRVGVVADAGSAKASGGGTD
ncbi:TrbG/VirB9 family P-type conjugative transfer protein [Sphingomonas sp.]|uniref:TrbG/VirB9 family P-type conjugative transfer protein n=1 Tax=Sphingomonas sp. TaxID=28214 RepID=UPI001B0CE416|nr:TrbG/VirB9 family P-type conjugative transfer protein [Sphingomonas sp.]MBO9712265.1 TrbG/VirB9 family P-type conjugative transfer protein [Sphingomonas sp.]